MTDRHRHRPQSSIGAQIGASIGLGFVFLMSLGLAYQGLWIVGVPVALVTGFFLIRTLLGRTSLGRASLGRTHRRGGNPDDGAPRDMTDYRP